MKTICIYHSRDLDGWMSAAIVMKWFIDEHEDGKSGCTVDGMMYGHTDHASKNILELIGWDYGNGIPDLSKYDEIIMCDVSFPKEVMHTLNSELTDVREQVVQKAGRLKWIDHHVSAINDIDGYQHNVVVEYDKYNNHVQHDCNVQDAPDIIIHGVRNSKYAACELTWMYFFNEEMPEMVRLLGRYDCFGHKGTPEEQTVLEFQYAARGVISNYEEAYRALTDKIMLSTEMSNVDVLLSAGRFIYKYLCTEAKQTYSKAFRIDLPSNFDGNDEGEHLPYKFLIVNQERFNPINFGIDYHKDGYDGFACFWLKDGKWSFSLYNDNGEVDCSAIAKAYGGGGHKGAAGFTCSKEKIIEYI